MLNNLCALMDSYHMLQPGDTLYCAVSGGADSMALLWSMYLLQEKLGICLRAVHYNHGLRGVESDRDEAFVREFCQRFDIELTVGAGQVTAGEKGLEAAAREARYGFFATLPGKIATAHTADDNAETVLMRLVRGTGLKGLGGITPVNGNIIRPMLDVTRQQVLDFLDQYHIDYVTDGSNQTDDYLRNRLRHHVMPLLYQENPELACSLSQMARSLRWDEEFLQAQSAGALPDVSQLRTLPAAVRSRMLERFLKECGIREPERRHMALMERLVFASNPSACGYFPGGIRIGRNYDRLELLPADAPPQPVALPMEGSVTCAQWGIVVHVGPVTVPDDPWSFTVAPKGTLVLRERQSGDAMRLSGGTKTLKKLYIDRKIPAARRAFVPVLCDDEGVLGVGGIGVNLDRAVHNGPSVQIRIEPLI